MLDGKSTPSDRTPFARAPIRISKGPAGSMSRDMPSAHNKAQSMLERTPPANDVLAPLAIIIQRGDVIGEWWWLMVECPRFPMIRKRGFHVYEADTPTSGASVSSNELNRAARYIRVDP